MKKREAVSTIMTKNAQTVQLDDSLASVRDLIRNHGFRHVPVVEGKQLVGIVSKTDLNRLTFSSLFAGQEQAAQILFRFGQGAKGSGEESKRLHAGDQSECGAEGSPRRRPRREDRRGARFYQREGAIQ